MQQCPARLGPQYRSAHFTGSLAWLGISDDPAFLGEPETNGCAERWIRTLNEQCLWVQLHDTVEELRQAVAGFVNRYNSSWLIHATATRPRRRPIRQLKRQQRHDQVGTTSVQETGRCSPATSTTSSVRKALRCC
jgi:transposase InsO family protein